MKTAEQIKIRMELLSNRNPVENAKIINKLKRKLRKAEANN